MDISVVIPVYGCKEALYELYESLTRVLSKMNKKYEIIFVNDNCPQNSIEVIKEICSKDKKVIGIDLSRNFGQMKAILAGLDYSKGDWVIVMDCDLQDNPEEIPRLFSKAQEGYDVVFAKRKHRKDNFIKVFFSKIFYKIYSIATDVDYDSDICNFSVCSRKVIDSYCSMREEHRAFVTYIQWLGFKQTTVDIEHNKRYVGKSSYTFRKRIKMASDIIFSQSDKILKLIVSFGFLMTFISLLAVVYVIIHYFLYPTNQGWTSIIAVICLMSGIIISVIGVVGIYVGNVFVQIKERPLYITKEIYNKK